MRKIRLACKRVSVAILSAIMIFTTAVSNGIVAKAEEEETVAAQSDVTENNESTDSTDGDSSDQGLEQSNEESQAQDEPQAVSQEEEAAPQQASEETVQEQAPQQTSDEVAQEQVQAKEESQALPESEQVSVQADDEQNTGQSPGQETDGLDSNQSLEQSQLLEDDKTDKADEDGKGEEGLDAVNNEEDETGTDEDDAEDGEIFTVVFINGLTGEQIGDSIQTKDPQNKEELFEFPKMEESVTKDDVKYQFDGWHVEINNTDMKATYTAQYKKVEEQKEEKKEEKKEELVTVTIKFNLNGGQGEFPDMVQTVAKGTKINLPSGDALKDAMPGYHLAFWTKSAHNVGDLNFRDIVDTYIANEDNATVTYYAYWQKDESETRLSVNYYIRLDGKIPSPYSSYPKSDYTAMVAGDYTNSVIAINGTYIYNPEGDVLDRISLSKPTDEQIKAALDAKNWKDGQERPYDPSLHKVCWYVLKREETDGYHIDGAVQLRSTVNIFYVSNLDKDAKVSNMPENQTGTEGCTFTVSDKEPTATLNNNVYQFEGWYYYNENGDKVSVGSGDKFENVTKNITVYAEWSMVSPPTVEDDKKGEDPGKDPTEKDPTGKDPTVKDPEDNDGKEDKPGTGDSEDPTEKDPEDNDGKEEQPGTGDSEDPTVKDPTEKDPTEKDPEDNDGKEEQPGTGDSEDPTVKDPTDDDKDKLPTVTITEKEDEKTPLAPTPTVTPSTPSSPTSTPTTPTTPSSTPSSTSTSATATSQESTPSAVLTSTPVTAPTSTTTSVTYSPVITSSVTLPAAVTTPVPVVTTVPQLTTIADEQSALASTMEINDEDTPLADTISINDEDTPLAASMPSTGDQSRNAVPFAAAGIFTIALAIIVNRIIKKKI